MSKKRGGEALIIGSAGVLGRALFQAMKKRYKLHEHDIKPKVIKGGRETIELKVDPKEVNEIVMHICFPHSDKFDEQVENYWKFYNPPLIVIHSSVPVGTTQALVMKGLPVVHSPAFIDKNDYRYFPYFHKIIGYDDDRLGLMAHEHLRLCFNTFLIGHSKNTELGEIMLGLYTLTNVAIIQEMHRTFDLFECSYKDMMNFIDISNNGFVAIGKDRSMLPNFEPDAIGEDYRLKNIDLLAEDMRSAFFKLLLKSNNMEKEKLAKIEQIPISA